MTRNLFVILLAFPYFPLSSQHIFEKLCLGTQWTLSKTSITSKIAPTECNVNTLLKTNNLLQSKN
jgi:hypothetical protein